ncbi:hypothetical protein C481_02602 [Natrialba asiatica DSM 12278]|uniref:DUF488 domain-containing protein n=1 Tax=Natrialba asiatica (strain ATCC 700177 / DSM 12278 / JCM 9576 / FERM P-10747 / NBRC 102637 / 172P1) TaxID=29540 RepID=M0B5P8_NATA1|nr:hypothetical protein C481_02602 [Natrialba asiatica DSM 12278]
MLNQYEITLLADVRSFPRSRTNPQFDRDRLTDRLPKHDISYEHIEDLGGYRDTDLSASPNAAWDNDSFRTYADYALTEEFRTGLHELIALGERFTVAYVCAEKVYWRCHRRIISDWLLVRDHEVVHIFEADRTEAHSLTRFATVANETVTYPESEGG